jgi:Ni/Fe-hydrogenase subunit HybB-like protein
VVVLSLWAFDLIMTLDPIWYSGLLGGYFVVSSLYAGFGLVTFLVLRANERGTTNVPPSAIQDSAKLTFAMSIMWMYFFFSQYLIIWYGNVPPETRFFVRRFLGNQPWGYLAWAIFIVGWVIPFSYLLKRLTGRPPTRHKVLKVILVMGWVAIFFERVLLVFPSISKENRIPHGLIDILITAAFFSLFILSRGWFLARYRPVLNLPR